jgi:hypothetical protein
MVEVIERRTDGAAGELPHLFLRSQLSPEIHRMTDQNGIAATADLDHRDALLIPVPGLHIYLSIGE